MNTIEQILKDHFSDEFVTQWKSYFLDDGGKDPSCVLPLWSYYSHLEMAMKEYAALMCQRQKEICAENSYMSKNGIGMINNTGSLTGCKINPDSILNSPLPKELR